LEAPSPTDFAGRPTSKLRRPVEGIFMPNLSQRASVCDRPYISISLKAGCGHREKTAERPLDLFKRTPVKGGRREFIIEKGFQKTHSGCGKGPRVRRCAGSRECFRRREAATTRSDAVGIADSTPRFRPPDNAPGLRDSGTSVLEKTQFTHDQSPPLFPGNHASSA